MKTIRLSSAEQLSQHFRSLTEESLFRGQVSHYALRMGAPALSSSFSRKGCIPPLQFKWSFYVGELLRILHAPLEDNSSQDLIQAMLQHYGWRSFYVDLTSSPAVAAWFASNKFENRNTLHMSETSEEDPVLLAHFGATYVPASDTGHVYVLSRDILLQQHKLIDLEDIFKADYRERTKTQKAWLAGVLGKPDDHLFPLSIKEHLIVPTEALREFAATEGYDSVESMFPPPEEDFLLKQLLRLPWNRLESKEEKPGDISMYSRSLQLPDYYVKFEKFLPPDVTLYSPTWITSDFTEIDNIPGFRRALALQTPEINFYVRRTIESSFQKILALLEEHKALIFESKYLLCYPRNPFSFEYVKGVYVSLSSAGEITVGAFTIDHPSDQIIGWGLNFGYSYYRNGDQLVRAPSESDCPCADEMRHRQHLDVLAACERYLREHQYTQISDRILRLGEISEWGQA